MVNFTYSSPLHTYIHILTISKPKGTHHQFADAIAAGGHYVVMPDFFQGGSIEPYYASNTVPEGVEWLKKFNWKHCSGILDKVYDHITEKVCIYLSHQVQSRDDNTG